MKLICVSFVSAWLFLCGDALSSTEENGFIGNATITIQSNRYIIESNGLPFHTTTESLEGTAQTHKFKIRKNPTKQSAPTCLNNARIGITIDGVVIFGPLTSQSYNAIDGSHSEKIGFDECNGHNSPSDVYHHHYLPKCVYGDSEPVDKFVGVAFDGFPIYGPKSSWIDSSRYATAEDLDECHGIENNGDYRYILTLDFPYIMGCFWGEVIDRKVNNIDGFGDECVEDAVEEDEEEFRHWSGSYGKLCRCNANYPDDFDDDEETKKRQFDIKKAERKYSGNVVRKLVKSPHIHHLKHNQRHHDASNRLENKVRSDKKAEDPAIQSEYKELSRLLKKWLKQKI